MLDIYKCALLLVEKPYGTAQFNCFRLTWFPCTSLGNPRYFADIVILGEATIQVVWAKVEEQDTMIKELKNQIQVKEYEFQEYKDILLFEPCICLLAPIASKDP